MLLGGARVAAADQITFPLVVDHPVLAAALLQSLRPGADGSAVLWGTAGGCRSVTVRDLHVERGDARLRITATGRARLGFGFLGLCIAPISWDGHLDTLASPTIGPDWQLRLTDLDSHVYDPAWRRTVVASRLWDVIKPQFEERVTEFAFDLGPPVDEAKALIRASAEPERTRPVRAALDTLRPLSVTVDDDGIRVPVAMDVPPSETATGGPAPPLAPMEPARWQAALESWDAFLVFVVKEIAALRVDPSVRDELLAILLDSRERLLTALASGPEAGVDPVRQLFLDSWDRLRQVVRDVAAHGALGDRALRYVAFVAAGDALAALDGLGPSLGLEISADGLRRLALVLEPGYAGDPIAYSESPDSVLRDLFHFHEPASSPPGTAEPEPEPSSWLGGRAAWAASAPVTEINAVLRRLDRWVPRPEELGEYRDGVARLLTSDAERTADSNQVEARFRELFQHLVAATAWQESCWRQFVQRNGRVTYLLSSTGDVGIMQVNRRVWRGFFDVRKLEWDVGYNAGAGAEILAQLFTRYGIREANERPENAARATYAAYNGGPDAYRRYRGARVPLKLRAIDVAFWEKYQAIAAGQGLDFVLCVERWGTTPSRARLSTGPLASTSKCCISSRSSCATSTMPARHASIASRPRASFV
ncbi:MAG TPA: transglycosylase SLT domain-containing protein [Candidatus Binatia bacterium]|nr:transglycosylase SLT domain-containing protein [Candidatus Binatia bacterium]